MGTSIYMFDHSQSKQSWDFLGDENGGVFVCAGVALPEIVQQQVIGKPFNEIVDGCPLLRYLLTTAVVSDIAVLENGTRIWVKY